MIQLKNTFNLFPKFTAVQIAALSGMIEGYIVYDTTNHKYQFYNGSSWVDMGVAV